ncbi:MAG: aminotransferase class V-fold PLP-dependent enzyme, partial [Rubricoccaceae bacterium]|nr:aminotransferase class V-fold PLP-dependent enzyme [Rubricoccaceae bacterium]
MNLESSAVTTQRLHNFSAGPGALPEEVMQEVADELPVYRDLGSSIMEISHRSAAYTEINESAMSRMKGLLGMGDEWQVMFLQGGASMQFYQVPLNFIPEGGSADYVNTGSWSTKAIKEARRCGSVNVAASSAEANFNHIPAQDAWQTDPNAAYLHFTSNNTIFGTQFADEPTVEVPLVC